MRTHGNTVAGGVVGDVAHGLPMEEREDRDVVRARREAKRGRQLARSPFAGLATSEKDAIASQAQAAAVATSALAEAKYTTPVLEPEPVVEQAAAPDVEPDVSPGAEPAPEPGPRDDEHQALAVVEAPAPKPIPRPTPKPATRTARAHPPLDAAGIVREYVEDRHSIPEIAKRRGHSTSTVRRVLKGTPGVEIRDDRKTNSGASAKDYDPTLVEAVRALYTGDERLTQAQVAERLDIGQHVVQRIMARYDIPARPAAHERTAATMSGTSPAELMAQRLADAGVTTQQVRAWAREHGLACPATGRVPQRLLGAYLRADGGAPVEPDVTDLALTRPDPESTPLALADDSIPETDERPCAECGELVGCLSSRDWCDACELDERRAGLPFTAVLTTGGTIPQRIDAHAVLTPPALAVPDVVAGLVDGVQAAARTPGVGLDAVLRAAGDLLHAVAGIVATTKGDYALAADGEA
ncbi:Lsr2 family DNA-binding protein [Cellulosimicrobium sp. 22601]|uniref:Lsr2 family DNA-binding protein n=1 Tax=unclassified Cellulosimicrobium TaxID=2624466 RepID=UPI003F827B42